MLCHEAHGLSLKEKFVSLDLTINNLRCCVSKCVYKYENGKVKFRDHYLRMQGNHNER